MPNGEDKASIVLAENTKVRIDGLTGERTDLEAERQAQLAASNKSSKEFAAREEARKKQSAETPKASGRMRRNLSRDG